MASVSHQQRKNFPLNFSRRIIVFTCSIVFAIVGCRRTRLDVLPAPLTSIVSYQVEVEVTDVPSKDMNKVIELMTSVDSGIFQVIQDINPLVFSCKIRAWFEKLSPVGEEKIWYKLGLNFPASRLTIFRKIIN